jgi:tripartite-type tricarboxylate transporter receptor subunit TctC
VRIVVGFAAGGTQDIVARLVAQALSDRLGQQFVIENKPGAAGNIAADTVVHALGDGYTLLVVGLSNAVNASLYEKMTFDFLRDIAPVAAIVRVPGVMVVNPTLPVQNVTEFIAYARSSSRPINMATAGVGAPQHVYGELFKMMTGLNMTHVPYRGGAPAVSDLIGGQVQMILNPLPETIEHIRAGRLRVLAVTTAERASTLPDVPALKEFLPGFDASSWYGVGAPKSTPTEIMNRLNAEINAAVNEPKLKTRLMDLGGVVISGSPSDFGKLIADETQKWAKVIKFSGAKAE